MAKSKNEPVKPIRPSEAIRSLAAFNESVFALTQTVKLALSHKLVDKTISQQLEDNIVEINKFYSE